MEMSLQSPQVAPPDDHCPTGTAGWCCVQAGHREQYGIPRALQRVGVLDRLITDVWVPPGSVFAALTPGRWGRRLRDRFHAELPLDKVNASPWRSLGWSAGASLRGLGGGRRVVARNTWWAGLAAGELRRNGTPTTRRIFSYCYETGGLFAVARELGLTTVLGQIDPGPVEDVKVAEIVRRWTSYRTSFQPGSDEYYENWRNECRYACHIVVNSEWSGAALVEAGVPEYKITVCPLVYTPPSEAVQWAKAYPESYSGNRPLRVLFLGQCILRKGIAETIQAAQRLRNRPVEFTFVGNTDIAGFESHFGGACIRHIPRVSRAECHAFYREADVFLFPTHSDGFGLTQLEAQAWKLPIIASRFCGEVVAPGRTGWVLPDVSSNSIVDAVEHILAHPAALAAFSRAIAPWTYDLEQLGGCLARLGEALP